MDQRKALIVSGLLFIVLSMIYGSIYGAAFLTPLSQARQAAMENGFSDPQRAGAVAGQVEKLNRVMSQHRSSHSHLALFGVIALVLGGTLNWIDLSKGWLNAATVTFIAGSVILPLGVFLEPVYNANTGKIVALSGGVLLVFATAVFLIGALKNTAGED